MGEQVVNARVYAIINWSSQWKGWASYHILEFCLPASIEKQDIGDKRIYSFAFIFLFFPMHTPVLYSRLCFHFPKTSNSVSLFRFETRELNKSLEPTRSFWRKCTSHSFCLRIINGCLWLYLSPDLTRSAFGEIWQKALALALHLQPLLHPQVFCSLDRPAWTNSCLCTTRYAVKNTLLSPGPTPVWPTVHYLYFFFHVFFWFKEISCKRRCFQVQ